MSGSASGATMVDFFSRFTASEQFEKVFKEGMGLVEETANYLDGPGRQDARLLDRHGAIAYATESMRLTTRLMQLASWLLLQRAIGSGELTNEDARKEKHRISLSDIGRGNPLTGEEQLPESLKELVERSLRLHIRVQKLDAMLNVQEKATARSASPISDQLDRLATALKAGRA
jgi:regulator of CtrA degradation